MENGKKKYPKNNKTLSCFYMKDEFETTGFELFIEKHRKWKTETNC